MATKFSKPAILIVVVLLMGCSSPAKNSSVKESPTTTSKSGSGTVKYKYGEKATFKQDMLGLTSVTVFGVYDGVTLRNVDIQSGETLVAADVEVCFGSKAISPEGTSGNFVFVLSDGSSQDLLGISNVGIDGITSPPDLVNSKSLDAALSESKPNSCGRGVIGVPIKAGLTVSSVRIPGNDAFLRPSTREWS